MQTIGAAISTGTPVRLSAAVLGLRMVHADGHRTSYSIERDPGLFDAMRVSLGATGVITQIELHCTELRPGSLQRKQVSFSEALSTLEAADAVTAGRIVTWFANAPAFVDYWDTNAPPAPAAHLLEQARSVVHEALGSRLLCGLAATLPSGARWSDSIGAAWAPSAVNGTLPVHSVPTAQRIAWSIPSNDAAETLLRLRDLWRSERFRVYAPVRIEFAPADTAWLSPAHGRDSALVSFPCTELTSKEFVDAVCALIAGRGGRPAWSQMQLHAAPPTVAQYPRLNDFAAVRQKIDRRGVFLNGYLSSLFGLHTR